MRNWYKSGDYNTVCDVCGFRFKASELTKRWDEAMVCRDDFEPRHSLDLIRAPAVEQPLPWSRPRPAEVYIDVTYNTAVETTIPTGSFTDDPNP